VGLLSGIKWFVAAVKASKAFKAIKIIGAIVTLTVGVKGFMMARQMLAKGQDILANKTSAGGKIPIIYGTRRVGTQIIYMDTSANDSRDLYVVYALAVGECEEIIGRSIELDGNPLTDSARFRNGGYIGTDKISSGNGSLNSVSQNGTNSLNLAGGTFGTSPTAKYRYVMNLHHGAATQTADPMLVASMPNWTSAHKLNGVCYIAAHYGFDKEGMWSGVPQLTVQVKGKKVFDPRDASQTFGNVSTYKWSDNPALCFLDYITNDEYGKGLPIAKVNTSTFTTAANTADTLVDPPFHNGSSQSITWSGANGNDFISVLGANANRDWFQNKIGEHITLVNSSGSTILNDVNIKDVRRDEFYDASEVYNVFVDETLDADYSSNTGTYLLKVKRFHCNGVIDANKNVMDNAKELLANMRGIFLYVDGKYELEIEDTGSSTFSITDDHVIAEAGIAVDYGNKDQRANKVIVEFFNANKKYELDTATVLHSATTDASDFTSDDGGEELEVKAEFPLITDPYIAHNMGKAILTRSRNQTTIQFLGTPEMYKLNVGDIVDFTYAGLGFSSKVCRVEALELQSDGLVSVSLIEYFDVYTWEVPAQEPLEELANLPSAFAVKAPTGLSFTDTDSSSTGRPFLSWNEPTDFPDYQYRVNVVDSSGNQVVNKIVDVTNCDLIFVPKDTNYVASVSSLNVLGSESSPATLTFTIGQEPVVTGDVRDAAIITDKINDGAITTVKIGDAQITNAKINDLSAEKINAGTIATARLNVSDIISTGNIIVQNDNISDLTNNSGFVDASGAASAAPVQSVAGGTGAVSASTIISAGNIVVQGDNISDLTNDSSFINGGQVNSNVTAISGGAITTGTVAAARIDVSGVISAGGIIVSSNLTDGSTSISGSNIDTGTINANRLQIDDVTIDTDGSGNLIIKSGGVGTTQIADDAVTDAKVSNLSANSITTDTLDSARINVDTLDVKHFANVSADIVSHTGSTVPLSVFGSAFQRASTDFKQQTQTTGNFLPLSVSNVRNNAKYQAIFTGVLGDNTGIFVEYSVDGGTTFIQAAGGIQDIDMDAGTFRTYVFVYSGDITGLGSSATTVNWRVRFVTKHRSTYLSLYVFIDNTQ